MTVSITLDNRERGLKALFEDNAALQNIEYKNLELGDIIIRAQHITFVFERKTIDDLRASIKDGRYHDQKKRLKSIVSQDTSVFYIIEGGCTYACTTDAAIKSAMINTILRDSIGVFRTVSMRDTYDLICAIVKRVQETPEKYTKQICGGNLETSQTLTPAALSTHRKENVYINMLCQIPGVSLKTAKAIEAAYPSWTDIMALAVEPEEEKLKKLKAITTCDSKGSCRKISSAAAQNILRALFE